MTEDLSTPRGRSVALSEARDVPAVPWLCTTRKVMIAVMRRLSACVGLLVGSILSSGLVLSGENGQFGTPKGSEGTRIFKGVEHPYYSGDYRLSGQRATLVGSMQDASPWDHMDYAGKRLSSVQGTIEIEVNEIANTGRVHVEFAEGADRFRITLIVFRPRPPSRME